MLLRYSVRAGFGRVGFLVLLALCGVTGAGLGLYVSGGFDASGPELDGRQAPSEAQAKPVRIDAQAAAKAVVGRARAGFALPDATGRTRSISEWDGNLVVLNFWATWCAPCREEVPVLVDMQARHAERGLQVIGIALDRVEPVRAFAEEFSVNYPSLFSELEGMRVARDYGNPLGVLPYTVVIDRDGVVRYTHLGAVTEAELEEAVAAVL